MKAITYDPYANLTSDAQKDLVVGGESPFPQTPEVRADNPRPGVALG